MPSTPVAIDGKILKQRTRPERAPKRSAVRVQASAERLFTAAEAADAFPGFPAGREAFVEWSKGKVAAGVKHAVWAVWEALLHEFAGRPIHGHRRGRKGNARRSHR